ncbi:PREDICTED: DBIRD complex subunit ZNF326 [Fragaria vesca subsp. vesca]|uniref:DBIRD complex subunit ZNF326 n=1 Tax=Fragaria vesca subsp. vesca TaxID=101020 RepID=UPI0002C33D9D|nr:PREDICTED: DBIRD complex subunit ZNF326 [Fragaria vesca subsp. vesca]
MAATVSSPWAKPGAWALDAEEHEAELEQQTKIETQPLADFPSLSAAAAKPKKKSKGQKVSLAEFTTFGGPKPVQAEPVGLTHEDRLVLPTGPRERTAEELDRSRGFRSYGGDRVNREESNSKWGSQRREGGGFGGEKTDRDAPSRADEADDWGVGKKSVGNGFERRERAGFGFGSQSKADESDSWVSNKSSFSSLRSGGGGGFERERKVGFASNGGGADSESWGRKREESNGGFERERKVGLEFNSNGGGADAESWGRRREESNGGTETTGRPRLNLQPRTLPVTLPPPVVSDETSPVAAPVAPEIVPRPRSTNPFGAARPREEVLAEKGQDWKKIDEQLESVKLKEKEAVAAEGESFGKRSFGMGSGRSGDRTEGAWRKPVVAEAEGEARPQSAGNDEIESRSSNSEELEPENESENVTEN